MQGGSRRLGRGRMWGGGTPSHRVRSLERGLCLLPRKKMNFSLKMMNFGAF